MNRIKILIILLALIFVFHPLAAAQSGPSETYSRVIVKLDVPNLETLTANSTKYKGISPGESFPAKGHEADEALRKAIEKSADELLFKLNGKGYTLTRVYDFLPCIAVRVSREALDFLERDKGVLAILEDKGHPVLTYSGPIKEIPGSIIKAAGPIDSPGISMPMLDFTVDLIGASDTWNMGWTGAGWYVAVLDSGIYPAHDFFAGKDIVEHCFSGFGDCPNGQNEMDGPGSAAHHPITYVGWDHGTSTTGVAVGNNGTLSGVAKDSDIIAVQVTSRLDQDCYPSWPGYQPCVMDYDSDVLAGLDYVYGLRTNYPIASVNISLGDQVQHTSACDTDIRFTAISNLRAVGIATAIASGNEKYCNGINAPACITPAIAVGASDDDDDEWHENNMGTNWHATMLSLFAPGHRVNTSEGGAPNAYTGNSLSGTSLAAPHVAGAWALAKQSWSAAPVDDLLTAFQDTGHPISPIGCNTSETIPRIQIDDAILSFRSIVFRLPLLRHVLDIFNELVIDWEPRAMRGDIKIEIQSANKIIDCSKSEIMVIEEKYPVDKPPYSWRIPKCFWSGQYRIIISQGSENWLSDSFTVGGLNISEPQEGQQYQTGHTLKIRWSTDGLAYGTLDMFLKSTDGKYVYTIAQGLSYDLNLYDWDIPGPVQPNEYVVEIVLDQIVRRSGAITVQ